jgi:hypothetical protein
MAKHNRGGFIGKATAKAIVFVRWGRDNYKNF